MLMAFLMIRHWALPYIRLFHLGLFFFKFRARFIVLSLGDPFRRLCYWTGWDPQELVRAAEVFTPGVNV